MRYLLLLLSGLFLLLATACADDDLQPRRNETDLEALDRLVPITQSGAGAFGCLLNGELWIPEAVFDEEAVDARYFNDNDLTIVADKQPISDNRDQFIIIGTIFSVNAKTPLKTFSEWVDATIETGECGLLSVDTLQENYMRITHFDQISRTVSGTFKAVFTSPNCPQDTIRLTEGRFDLPYRD